MKNVLKNILFSICFTYLDKNRGNPPCYIFMRAKETVNGNRGVEDGGEGEIMGKITEK